MICVFVSVHTCKSFCFLVYDLLSRTQLGVVLWYAIWCDFLFQFLQVFDAQLDAIPYFKLGGSLEWPDTISYFNFGGYLACNLMRLHFPTLEIASGHINLGLRTPLGRHRASAALQAQLWGITVHAQHSSCCCRHRCRTASHSSDCCGMRLCQQHVRWTKQSKPGV